MRRLLVSTLWATALAVAVPGCFWATTKSEGKALRRDVDSLDARVAKKEESLDAKLEQLKTVLDEATKILKRNSAGLGADVQAMQDEQRVLRGLVTAAKAYSDEIKASLDKLRADDAARFDAIETRLATIEQKNAAPSNPEDLWTHGKAAFEAGRYPEASELFKRLALQFPQHDRADDAQYFRAEAYFAQKDYDAAIREYQKVLDKY